MSVRYRALGSDKRIADIVFAGSHDASITSGKWNAKTQAKGIGGQAECGVRIFDLRILARAGSDGASLVGYHGNKGGKKTKSMFSSHTGTSGDIVTHSRMNLGTFGEKLSVMLEEAGNFVAKTGEFLIFKFDKCTNYQLIAQYCVSLLGDTIYKPTNITREFGKCTLGELGGHVVCVFGDGNLSEINGLGAADGVLGFRNLKAKDGPPKPYKAGYPGLQYYGKGGTNPWHFWRTKSGKISDNEKKQRKLMLEMAASSDPQASDVLGMMYWTTTGLAHSIKTRNKKMWKKSNVTRMEELWANGLEDAIGTQLALNQIKYMEYGEKRRIKAFFPNIVMVDFADDSKCETIYKLNETVDDRLTEAFGMAEDLGFQ